MVLPILENKTPLFSEVLETIISVAVGLGFRNYQPPRILALLHPARSTYFKLFGFTPNILITQWCYWLYRSD